ncbi:MAG: SGNH/GDSL hydrolase family protein [Candidatus Aquirickettsiella sp.]
MSNILLADESVITGGIFVGDSLSEEQRKYNETICGCIPFKWFLYHSDYNNFTNGHTWAYMFGNIFNNILKQKANWSAQEKATYFKNVAEGGATTYDYRNIKSFFKHPKGYIMSFFLGNIQNQAKKVKKDKNILNFNMLGIIFAGANDLVTLGYYDVEGVERAVQGIINTIAILTKRTERTGANYLKHLLFVGLPDISETPRFKNKSPEEKLKMKLACQQYNQKLQELANEYQDVNFDLCTIYNYKDINHLDLKKVKSIEKGIIVTGEGKNKTVLFINNGKFITNKSNNELKKVNISLTKKQLAIFSKDGQIIRDKINENKLDKFIKNVTKKAKLNIDIKMIGIEAILDEILQNPEVHGFTSGCAVYYLPESEGQGSDLSLLKKITAGNAVVIKKTNNEFFSYIIKDGQLIKEESKPVLQKFDLSKEALDQLNEKIKKSSAESKVIILANKEDIHNFWIINIIKSVVEHYKKSFDNKIVLTSINDSVLEAVKKDYLNRNTIFWDDLHPARRLHELLALKITEYIKANYAIKNQSQFEDDSSIDTESMLNSDKIEEAPPSLPSEPSLLYSDNIFRS